MQTTQAQIYPPLIKTRTLTAPIKVTLTINGGVFYQQIAVASSKEGAYNGSFKLNLNGGEFAHLVALCGSEGLSGNMTSTLNTRVDINQKQTGTYNFSNPVQDDGADPWIFYNNG